MRKTILAPLVGAVLLAPPLSGTNAQRRSRRPARKRRVRTPRAKTRRPKSPAQLRRLRTERYRRRQAEERKRHDREIARWSSKLKTGLPPDERDEALFHLADAYAAAGRTDAAVATLKKLTTRAADSSWFGEARLRLLDIVLFDQCNFAEADKLAHSGLHRAESHARPQAQRNQSPRPQPNRLRKSNKKATRTDAISDGLPRTPAQIAAGFCRREGLLRYLQGDLKGAGASFRCALRFGVKRRRTRDLSDLAIERARFTVLSYRRASRAVKKVSNGGKKVVAPAASQLPTPQLALRGNPQVSALLRFANLLDSARDFRRCGKCCKRVLQLAATSEASGKSPKPVQAAQISYAHYLHGRSLYASGNPALRAKAKTDYLTAQQRAPKAPWAGDALFLAGNVAFNHQRRTDEAISLWQRVVHEYPESRNAPRAAYFVGIAWELDEKYPKAKAAFEAALAAFPKDPFAKLVKEHLRKVQAKLARSR